MPEISVIMPVYNAQQYLNKSIHSVMNQSFTNFELILINDGSTDYSLLYCNIFAAKDKRIRVIDLPHNGVVTARTEGILAAKGNYISFIDADDWVEKDYLKHLYTAITTGNPDIVMCRTIIDAANRSFYTECPIESGEYFGYALEQLKKSKLLFSKDTNPFFSLTYLWDKLFHIELIRENIRYYDKCSFIGTDILLITACFLDCKSIRMIDAWDYHYYQRGGSIVHSQEKRSAETRIKEVEFHRKALQKIVKEKQYGELNNQVNAMTIYRLYSIILLYGTEKIKPIRGELKDLIQSQSENDGCEQWVKAVRALKNYIE